jgi:hypothetical protein
VTTNYRSKAASVGGLFHSGFKKIFITLSISIILSASLIVSANKSRLSVPLTEHSWASGTIPPFPLDVFGQAVGALAMPEISYRSLEHSCQRQASITSDPEARKALEEMAREYRDRADHQERQQKSNE